MVKNSTPERLTSMSPSSLMPRLDSPALLEVMQRGSGLTQRSLSLILSRERGDQGTHKQAMKTLCGTFNVSHVSEETGSPEGRFTPPVIAPPLPSPLSTSTPGCSLRFPEKEIPFSSDVRPDRQCFLWERQALSRLVCPARWAV